MKCLNCGAELPDDAVKCDVCGLKLRKKSPGAAAQRLKMVGIGAGVGLVIVGAFAIPAFIGSASAQSATQGSRVASELVTQNELVVPAKASGLDASGSRIAVHVKGLTSGGTSVEQDGYVNQEGKGLSLEQGMYEVTAVGSPISSSGVIYNLPTASVSVEVTAEGGSSYTTSASLDLTPVDAASVTDEQIEAARQWALKDPDKSSSADQLAEAARQRRAAAQKAAEGSKKENEEKQEGAQSQSDQSSDDSNNSSGQSSDNSESSDNSSSYNSDDSNYSYNGGNYSGNYADTQTYYGGNATESNSNPSTPEQTQGGDTQSADSSQNSGGQQADSTPSDASSSSSSSSTDTGGSSSDQGSSSSSSAQPANGGTNASGNAPTA